MVAACVYYLLFGYFNIGHVVNQSPSDAASAAGVYEAVLRPCVERIFPVDKLRVQNHVALLALRLDVGQPVPCLQVFCARHGGCRRGGGKVAGRGCVVMSFGAEYAVYPSVLMFGKAHVVYVRGRDDVVGHGYGIVPEAEVVNSVGAFGHRKERLSVSSLHTDDQEILAVELDCARVERGVYAYTLHQVRV